MKNYFILFLLISTFAYSDNIKPDLTKEHCHAFGGNWERECLKKSSRGCKEFGDWYCRDRFEFQQKAIKTGVFTKDAKQWCEARGGVYRNLKRLFKCEGAKTKYGIARYPGDPSKLTTYCCLCQTGEGAIWETIIFKDGCQRWLSKQKQCRIEKIIGLNKNLSSHLPKNCFGRTLKLGYVGHWSGHFETTEFLEEQILPAMKEKKISVEYDNTACSALELPTGIESFLYDVLFPAGQYLTVTGNQVISVGEWDPFLPGRSNFYACFDSRKSCVVYPPCKVFEGSTCLSLQRREIGICIDQNNEQETLTCCTTEEKEVYQGFSFSPQSYYRKTKKVKTSYKWSKRSNCK